MTTGSPLTRRGATELGDAKADLNAIFIAALDRDGVLDAPVHRVQGVDSAPFWCGLGVPSCGGQPLAARGQPPAAPEYLRLRGHA